MTTGKAESTRSTFRRTVRVATTIRATPERVWALLTDAAGIPSWTSTVTRIDGRIALGERLTIVVPYSKRTFPVTVDVFDAPSRLVWSDGNAIFRGVRTYTITPSGPLTTFAMEEVFTGVMLPLIAGSLPDFAPIFEQYAAHLKAAAER
ncbi:MAG: SRPBCC family protein [Gemmatimonadaceae bacterium]